MNFKNTSIIILTFNNLKLTEDCINSIKLFAPKDTYEIIVVDNNSTDSTRDWLREEKQIKYILNDTNLGFPIGCNQGIAIANPENDILLLNNDTIFTPNLLENMRLALYSSDDIGAVGPVSNSVSNEQQISVALNNYSDIIEFAKSYNISNQKMWEEKCILIGYCFLIKNSVLKIVGDLDPIYTPGNYEDCDYSIRITQAGYKLLALHDTFIYHLGSATFKENPSVYSHFNSNRIKFEDKWGFNHNYVSKLKDDLFYLVNSNEYQNINILEIDCGIGINLLKLKFKHPSSNIYGIEFNTKLSEFTSNSINLSNNFLSDFQEDFFDYIIIDDSIHNALSINKYLSELYKYLKPNGHLILKIYNFLFANNLVEMFNGKVATSTLSLKNKFTFYDITEIMKSCGFTLKFANYHLAPLTTEANELIPKIRPLTANDKSYEYSTKYYTMDFIKI